MSQDARFDEEQATQRRARVLGYDYVDTSQIANKTLYKNILNLSDLYQMRIIPLQADKSNILFGITTTTSQQTITAIKQHFQDQRLAFAIISDTGYADYMALYDPPKQVVYQDVIIKPGLEKEEINEISQILDQVKADDMLAFLVQQAHKLNASDIHIESQSKNVRIRFRIDGVLHPIAVLSIEKYRVLIAAIASAGNISTSATEAQQGHIAQKIIMANESDVDVNVRLETVPTINGMDIVMRLFNMDADMYTLDRLALSPEERTIVDSIIARPSGLVLVVGPTGSGKTTTLYSILNTLNSDERKIITIEDPVEYQFEGVSQISVTSNVEGNDLSFASKLRAVLRLDPDIVMVGEIRDNDTAKTSLQAALTGHLVLSTFHAGSAAAALTRLADVTANNPLYISAIRLVMAQRLIRQLDDTTKEVYIPSEAEKDKIASILATLPVGIEKPNIEDLKLYKPGKSADNPYGFKGQLAIREQFLLTGGLRTLLQNKDKRELTTQDIEATALKDGMKTMLQDGILKVISGKTTLEEVFRVIG